MSHPEKSEIDVEALSIFRCLASPIGQTGHATARQELFNRFTAFNSPLISQPQPQRPSATRTNLCSPNPGLSANPLHQFTDEDFPQLFGQEFRFTPDSVDPRRLFALSPSPALPLASGKFENFPPFSPVVPENPSSSIRVESRVLFNPLKNLEFLNTNGIVVQEQLTLMTTDRSIEVLSFTLRHFNSFYKSKQNNRPTALFPRHPPAISDKKLAAAHRFIKKRPPHSPSKPLRTNTNLERRRRKSIHCNCRNTKCVKLYCECFRNDLFCGQQCKCSGCGNNHRDFDDRVRSGKGQLSRKGSCAVPEEKAGDPNPQAPTASAFNGCNCKKSKCQKKYCDCFSNGLACSEKCKCLGCVNCTELYTSNATNKAFSRDHHAFVGSVGQRD